jgi:hypothetical protein
MFFSSKHHSERPANRPTTIITPHSLCGATTLQNRTQSQKQNRVPHPASLSRVGGFVAARASQQRTTMKSFSRPSTTLSAPQTAPPQSSRHIHSVGAGLRPARFRFANKSKTEPDANEFKPGTPTKPPTLLTNAGWGTHLRVCNRAERSAELRRGDYLKPKTLKTFTQKSSPTESRWTFPPAQSHSPAWPRAHRSQIPAGSARILHSAAICPRLRTANACR